jgi:hypothetical protein
MRSIRIQLSQLRGAARSLSVALAIGLLSTLVATEARGGHRH